MLKSQLNYLLFYVVVCSFTLLCSVLIFKHFVAFEKWSTNQIIISSCGRRNKSQHKSAKFHGAQTVLSRRNE